MLTLKTAIGSYPHTRTLKTTPRLGDRAVLEHVEITPVSDAFKPMCRTLAFDVCEMSITGYLLGRVYDKGFTALPVFPVRVFGSSHASILCNRSAGIAQPKDLESRSIGARAYTGAASFWARAALAHDFGVDTDAITWISSDEEHVLEYQADAPANAAYQLGANLNAMLCAGEIAAGIGLKPDCPDVEPLVSNARAAALDFYRRTGIYQINHVIVVKDALLAEHPWLAPILYEAFDAAKRDWLAASPDLAGTAELDLPGGDPFPYGVRDNRVSLTALVQCAREQHILPRDYTVEELFPLSLD